MKETSKNRRRLEHLPKVLSVRSTSLGTSSDGAWLQSHIDEAELRGQVRCQARAWQRGKDATARLYLDGQLAAENQQFALTPEDVRARAGRIGAGVAGTGFTGRLDDFAVYRTGFASVEEIPAAAKATP